MRWRRSASLPEIIPGARGFLHGIRWGAPALTLFFCMRYLSEGMHWTLPTMLIGFGGLALLAPLGYAFTFGRFGLPEMGAGGPGRSLGDHDVDAGARLRRLSVEYGTLRPPAICSRVSTARMPNRSRNCCAPACRSA